MTDQSILHSTRVPSRSPWLSILIRVVCWVLTGFFQSFAGFQDQPGEKSQGREIFCPPPMEQGINSLSE